MNKEHLTPEEIEELPKKERPTNGEENELIDLEENQK
jgi:hypothetical protein